MSPAAGGPRDSAWPPSAYNALTRHLPQTAALAERPCGDCQHCCNAGPLSALHCSIGSLLCFQRVASRLVRMLVDARQPHNAYVGRPHKMEAESPPDRHEADLGKFLLLAHEICVQTCYLSVASDYFLPATAGWRIRRAGNYRRRLSAAD